MTVKQDTSTSGRVRSKTEPGRAQGRVQSWTAGLTAELAAFRSDVRGAMAIAMGFFMVLLMGMAVLALDVGRMVVVEIQMQHAADAAALAAAVQLTGAPGSIALATSVANNAAQQSSEFPLGATVTLSVNTVDFFQNWTPGVGGVMGTGTPATADENAIVVRVTLNAQTLELLLQPVLDLLTTVTSSGTTVHTAYAVAQQSAISCKVTPLMMCNPMEDPDVPCDFSAGNIFDSQHIGKMLIMKAGPGNVPDAPGQFGMLQLPDGSSGAKALGEAMADSSGVGCTEPTVTTAPGSKTNQILWGVLARFGTSPKSAFNDPAPHVGTFPRDFGAGVVDLYLGSGQWENGGPAGYLGDAAKAYTTTHPFTIGRTFGGVGVDYPTRYQVYLWESGVKFLVNENITVYPYIASTEAAALTGIVGGWTTINGSVSATTNANDQPTTFNNNGAPDVDAPANIRGRENNLVLATDQDDVSSYAGTDNVEWVKRRNFRSAVLNCGCLGVAGSGTYPTNSHYIELFITEEPTQPGGNNSGVNMWAEYLGAPLTGFASQQDIVHNVQLIE